MSRRPRTDHGWRGVAGQRARCRSRVAEPTAPVVPVCPAPVHLLSRLTQASAVAPAIRIGLSVPRTRDLRPCRAHRRLGESVGGETTGSPEADRQRWLQATRPTVAKTE